MSDHFSAPGIEDEERAWRRGDYDRYGFFDDHEEDLPEHDDGELAGSPDTSPF